MFYRDESLQKSDVRFSVFTVYVFVFCNAASEKNQTAQKPLGM